VTVKSAPHDLDETPVAGRYELGPVLGVGSSAVVHRGWDLTDGEPVAVKLFRAGASPHDQRQQHQEMEALARLEHPGLVGLHDGGTEAGRPYVVTDLVEGPTLAERIVEGPLPVAEVRELGARLADALAAVHAGGFVHRDLKPANVLLERGRYPRLADFGISRAVDGTAATTAGCVLGTAAYLAPEQVRGQHVGPATDVYALGLVLLEMFTGRREYPGTALESATARLHRKPSVPPDLPRDLVQLIWAMTADDPDQRPTAATVAGCLARRPAADLLVGAGGPIGGHRRHRRRASGMSVGVGVSLVAAAALMLVVLFGALVLVVQPMTPTTGPAVEPVPMSPVEAPAATLR
jgi:serine/threonine protein kinase